MSDSIKSEIDTVSDAEAQKYLNKIKHVTANRHIIFAAYKKAFEAGYNYHRDLGKTDEELLKEAIDRTEKEFFP